MIRRMDDSTKMRAFPILRVLACAVMAVVVWVGCARTWNPGTAEIGRIYQRYPAPVREAARQGIFLMRSVPAMPSRVTFIGWFRLSSADKESLVMTMEGVEGYTIGRMAEARNSTTEEVVASLFEGVGFGLDDLKVPAEVSDWGKRIVLSHCSQSGDPWPWTGYALVSAESDVVIWIGADLNARP